MSFTNGFFNSLDKDRLYDARQFSRIFDGIINDGVYMSIGDKFIVTPSSGNTVNVGTGRFWFDGTWGWNDAITSIEMDPSDLLLSRIDAVVIETDQTESVRNDSIKKITGTPATNPLKPVMVHTDMVNQYPLCYIHRPVNSQSILATNIENAVGTAECPFVTGIIDRVDITELLKQWQAEWDTWRMNTTEETDDLLTIIERELDRLNEGTEYMTKTQYDKHEQITGTIPEYVASVASNENLIINGDFQIWQRGTSQTQSGFGSDDRWNNANGGTTKTHILMPFDQNQTEVPGAPLYFSRTTVVAGAANEDYCSKLQAIEDVTRLAGQTVTLSFWAKGDKQQEVSVEFNQWPTTTSPIRGIGVHKFIIDTSWKKYTAVVEIPAIATTIPNINTTYTTVIFWFDAGSDWDERTDSLGHQSGVFDLAMVKLEYGEMDTPLYRRLSGEELRLCQRYYKRNSLQVCSAMTGLDGYSVTVPTYAELSGMRAVPATNIEFDTGTRYLNMYELVTGGFHRPIFSSAYTDANLSFTQINFTRAAAITPLRPYYINTIGAWLVYDAEF